MRTRLGCAVTLHALELPWPHQPLPRDPDWFWAPVLVLPNSPCLMPLIYKTGGTLGVCCQVAVAPSVLEAGKTHRESLRLAGGCPGSSRAASQPPPLLTLHLLLLRGGPARPWWGPETASCRSWPTSHLPPTAHHAQTVKSSHALACISTGESLRRSHWCHTQTPRSGGVSRFGLTESRAERSGGWSRGGV